MAKFLLLFKKMMVRTKPMSNLNTNNSQARRAGEKRLDFRLGVIRHAVVFLVVNMLIWLAWPLIPKDPATLNWPLIISGGWLVVLIVHMLIVFVSNSPRQVRQQEMKREIQEQHLHRP